MNISEKYFFLLLVTNTNKNQKLSLLKSITPSQYKILKEITFKILNEIIVIDRKQLKKLKKHKKFIRKLGYSKVSGQVLAKNYSIIIEIVQIGLKENEICSEIYSSSKRRMGKHKSSNEKCEAFKYSKNRKEYSSSESSKESSESSEESSTSEFSSEEKYIQTSSRNSTSGEEFTEEEENEEEECTGKENSCENSETEKDITDNENQ